MFAKYEEMYEAVREELCMLANAHGCELHIEPTTHVHEHTFTIFERYSDIRRAPKVTINWDGVVSIDDTIACIKGYFAGHYRWIDCDKVDIRMPKIKNVIFNDPATIVFWMDGTKTVVKCQEGDIFDPEKGLAMAISKKALGNKGNYCNQIKKWTEKYHEKHSFYYSDEWKKIREAFLKAFGLMETSDD